MQVAVNQDTVKRFMDIVEENFSNGIRDDIIDTSKILKIFSADYPDEKIFLDSLIDIIHTNGIETGGRFYFISEDNIESILFFFDEILKKFSIAYYSSVYKKHLDFFYRMHIFSPEVLRKILLRYDSRHCHFSDFCSANKSTHLDYEITKIFMKSDNPLSLEILQKKLPYVPSEKFSRVLVDSKNFFMTQKNFFVLTSKIQFDEKEIESAKNKLFHLIKSEGYATLNDCDFSSNLAHNLEIPETDLQNIIYEKFFSCDFLKRGNKLFKKNSSRKRNSSGGLNDKLRKFIDNQQELSLKQLFSSAQNLGVSSTVALSAALEKMIRVDENFFIKDSMINFKVDEIDQALSSFVQEKIIPLRAVTSFIGFPVVSGHLWNLFLLESFLRKYSRKFVFNATGVNSSNTGCIYPKYMKFADYLEVQAAAVVQEKIPLKKSDVENFLLSQGYRSTRFDNVTTRIIKLAQEFLNK